MPCKKLFNSLLRLLHALLGVRHRFLARLFDPIRLVAHLPRVFGRPDFVFFAYHLAIFVDGCFWHGCPNHATKPKGNAEFWRRKFVANKDRDRLVTRNLRARGWRVLRIWEHELARRNEARLVRRIKGALDQAADEYS